MFTSSPKLHSRGPLLESLIRAAVLTRILVVAADRRQASLLIKLGFSVVLPDIALRPSA